MNTSSRDRYPGRHPTPLSTSSAPSNGRLVTLDDDNVAKGWLDQPSEKEKMKEESITWRSLPHRRQLAILTLARLAEPLVQTSLQVS